MGDRVSLVVVDYLFPRPHRIISPATRGRLVWRAGAACDLVVAGAGSVRVDTALGRGRLPVSRTSDPSKNHTAAKFMASWLTARLSGTGDWWECKRPGGLACPRSFQPVPDNTLRASVPAGLMALRHPGVGGRGIWTHMRR